MAVSYLARPCITRETPFVIRTTVARRDGVIVSNQRSLVIGFRVIVTVGLLECKARAWEYERDDEQAVIDGCGDSHPRSWESL